jgi:acetyl esterase/lipase
LTLRFGAARLRARVDWPRAGATAVVLALTDETARANGFLDNCVVVTPLGSRRPGDELGALEWLADHAGELGAGSGHLVLAGGARAARLAVTARDNGWPQLHRQVLIHPRFGPEHPVPFDVTGVAPATVICGDDRRDDGRRYAALLREAGVRVTEVRS